jgi:hypothetical protein
MPVCAGIETNCRIPSMAEEMIDNNAAFKIAVGILNSVFWQQFREGKQLCGKKM